MEILTIQQSPVTEVEKLRNAITQILSDKNELVEELEKERAARESDLKKWTQETLDLKAEFAKVAEEIANKPKLPSREQLREIELLTEQISQLEGEIRTSKMKLEDVHLEHDVLARQIAQYEKEIAKSEEAAEEAYAETDQYNKQKSQLSRLDDDLRMKTRKAKELTSSLQWTEHEIARVTQQIASLSGNKSASELITIDEVSIPPSNFSLHNTLQSCFREIHNSELDPGSEDSFAESLPSLLSSMEDENSQLMQLSAKLKHKCAKLAVKPVNKEPQVSPEKLRLVAKKLYESTKRKTEQINKLKKIIKRQRAALERVADSPTSQSALSVALRSTIQQLVTCAPSEQKILAAQGERLLDAIQGIFL